MAQLREIVIDASQPARLARFWASALDGYAVRVYEPDEVARLAAMGRTPETDPSVAVDGPGPTLFFQEAEEPKRSRNRIHLDLITAARSGEIERLCGMGASVRDHHDGYSVLLDPEGNEFCLRDPGQLSRTRTAPPRS